MRSDGTNVAITLLGAGVGNSENITSAVKGAATAALTAAAIAAPAIAGGMGTAEAASATTHKPQSASRPAAAPPAPRVASATPCGASAKACVVLSHHEAWLTRWEGADHLRSGAGHRGNLGGPHTDRHLPCAVQGRSFPQHRVPQRADALLGVFLPGRCLPRRQRPAMVTRLHPFEFE
jgi:hypothetical protein